MIAAAQAAQGRTLFAKLVAKVRESAETGSPTPVAVADTMALLEGGLNVTTLERQLAVLTVAENAFIALYQPEHEKWGDEFAPPPDDLAELEINRLAMVSAVMAFDRLAASP